MSELTPKRADVLAEEYKGTYLWAEIDRLRDDLCDEKTNAEKLAGALAEIAGLDYQGGQHISAGIAKNALAEYEDRK